jgi:ATP-dependent exoDNAse (exonuclease V) beta subunit
MSEVVITDATARSRAVDVRRSVIVQAPAGSGKTSLLVDRYLALLAAARKPEEVLVITFTRKAVEELRGRVLAALRSSADAVEGATGSAHRRELAERAAAVRRRDEDMGWRLADAPDRLAVFTIDALCARIARRMPWLSGLGGGLSVEPHCAALYREAAHALLAHLDRDGEHRDAVAAVLQHLDGNVPQFTRLITDMLSRREQWLTLTAAGDRDPGALRELLELGLRGAARQALEVVSRRLPADTLDALQAAVDGLLRAGGAQQAPFEALAGWSAHAVDDVDQVPAWQALANLLLVSKADQFYKSAPARAALHGVEAARAREVRALFREPLARCAGVPGLVEAFAAVMALPALRYDDDEWRLIECLFRVLKLALAELTVVFAREGRGDFSELATAAITALGEAEAPTDLALRLDHRIEHVLVDEFQDTSITHLALVQALCAGFSEGDGRSLFLVGDPMQSIYRFRQAEVGQFLHCMHGVLGQLRLTPLRLSTNFRSRPALVRWLNLTFSHVFPASDDAARSAVSFSPSCASRDDDEFEAVQLHAFEGDRDGSAQGAAVAREVARIRAAQPQHDIAVLVRARGHLPPVMAALEARGLRYRGVEIRALGEVPVVRDLLALTRALSHPLDRVAWLSLLRAPWCGVLLADLLALAEQDLEAPVLELLRGPAALRRLSADGRARCVRLLEALEPVLLAPDHRPIKRRVEAVWYRLGAPACYAPEAVRDAEAYLDLLAELHADGADLAVLEERLQQLYAAPEAGDVDVELMTMHKSKGLEFDHVILPLLDRRGRGEDTQLLLWSELALPAGSNLALAPGPASGEAAGRMRFVRGLEADKAANEIARLLYVACSRAREGLHLMASLTRNPGGDLAAPASGSLLHRLWPLLREPMTRALDVAPQAPVAAQSGEGVSPCVLLRVPGDWSGPEVADSPQPAPLQQPSAMEVLEYEWAGRSARHAGSVVHETLALIARDGAGAWPATRIAERRELFRARLRQLGLEEQALEEALVRVEAALVRTLSDPRGRWILDARHAGALSEYALSGWLDQRLVEVVLDRSFVDDEGVRWIIDYKTGEHTGGALEAFLDREVERYRGQLTRYARLMAGVEQRTIRLGLYFPMMGGWRSWALEAAP